MAEDLVELVITLVRDMLEAEGRTNVDLEPDTALFRKDGLLDSMGIVSLVVDLEQAIQDRHGVSIALADERALAQNEGPYESIRSLAEYASSVMGSAA